MSSVHLVDEIAQVFIVKIKHISLSENSIPKKAALIFAETYSNLMHFSDHHSI